MSEPVTEGTELGPLRVLPMARHARVERGNGLSPTQYAQLCMDCRRRRSSCSRPKLVPLFNESGKLVPTSHRWGHRHQRARLLPGFFCRRVQPGRAISALLTGVSQLRTRIMEMSTDAAGLSPLHSTPTRGRSPIAATLEAVARVPYGAHKHLVSGVL